jgi:hypothetical protein
MCGRYRRTTSEEELARLYHIPIPKQTDVPMSYNIVLSQKVLTIRFNPETRARSLDALQWGLIPYWAKDPKAAYRTINARAETIDKAQWYADMFLKFHLSDDKTKADQNSPHTIGTAGNEIWETGDWTAILQAKNGSPVHLQGHDAFVDIREGDDWKVRMEIFNVTPAPAAKPSPTTSPSSQQRSGS